MASSSAATPDTLITLKVNFDGATRRFKLPLRELTVASLEDKVRRALFAIVAYHTVRGVACPTFAIYPNTALV